MGKSKEYDLRKVVFNHESDTIIGSIINPDQDLSIFSQISEEVEDANTVSECLEAWINHPNVSINVKLAGILAFGALMQQLIESRQSNKAFIDQKKKKK